MLNAEKEDRSTSVPLPRAEHPLDVGWQRPEDEKLMWTHDRMHSPRPITPMTGDLGARSFEVGFNRAAAWFGLPLKVRFARLNGYSYQAVVPQAFGEEREAAGRQAQERLQGAMGDLLDQWNERWLPEIRQILAAWDVFDLAGASAGELLTHLDETIERSERLWEIHFLIGIPFLLAPSLFDEMYCELFGEDKALHSYRLIEGFDNKNLAAERALWQLGRKAAEDPRLAALFETAPDHLPDELADFQAGREFRESFDAFLAEFGQRTSEFVELASLSWIEDPAPVLNFLAEYMTVEGRDLNAERRAKEVERDRLTDQARSALEGFPQAVREKFEWLLKAAREAGFLHSEHAFWIDQRGMFRVRRVLLEIGARLCREGVLEERDDVFFLVADEARRGLRGSEGGDFRALVDRRRAQMEHFAAVAPPPVIGTLRKEEPPDSALHRAITKFIGDPRQARASGDELQGIAGAPGIVRGPARVVHSLDEIGKIRRGDVLVARTTAPQWAPVFTTAAGVVTDTGGVLSHCAVVAREYGLPAVVGTGVATSTLRDGQMLEIDGAAGLVRILGVDHS